MVVISFHFFLQSSEFYWPFGLLFDSGNSILSGVNSWCLYRDIFGGKLHNKTLTAMETQCSLCVRKAGICWFKHCSKGIFRCVIVRSVESNKNFQCTYRTVTGEADIANTRVTTGRQALWCWFESFSVWRWWKYLLEIRNSKISKVKHKWKCGKRGVCRIKEHIWESVLHAKAQSASTLLLLPPAPSPPST